MTLGSPYFYTWILYYDYFTDPKLFDVGKALFIGQIINEENTMGPFVVSTGYGPESLLTSRVPNLQFDDTVVDI